MFTRPVFFALFFILGLDFSLGLGSIQTARATEPLEVERVNITAADGMVLMADFYPVSTGRNSPVVVLLGDSGESRSVFRSLATRLQAPEEGEGTPMAVLAVDLRYQGDSTQQRTRDGSSSDMSGQKLAKRDIGMMVARDLEAVRAFLVDKNDKGQLNLNRLAYFGVGMGAVVAVNGAAVDWSAPMLQAGKQGKDVKALVLISPPWKYMGVPILDALRQPGVQQQVAFLMLYGKDDKASVRTAQKIVKQLERARGKMPEDDPNSSTHPSVLSIGGRTSLKGTKWLKQAGPNAEMLIAEYLEQYLVEPDHPWQQRVLK